MLEYSIERVETLSDEHLKEIADLHAQAFAADALACGSFLGGDWSLNTEYCNALLRAAVLEGEVYILTIEREGKREIASMTVLFPPGRLLFGTEAQRALGYNDFSKKLSPEAQDWKTNTYPKYIAKFLDEAFEDKEVSLAMMSIVRIDLATRPDLQRNGYATALMNIGFQKAKKTKELGTSLGVMTTDENVNKYVSMGFKRVAQMDFPYMTGNSGINMMMRKP